MRGRLTTLATATTVLVLSGCADDGTDVQDDTGVTDDTPTATDTETPAGDDGTAAAGVTVIVEDITFQDQTATVPAGTPVTWTNQDAVAHTVTAGEPGNPTGEFDEQLPANGKVSITLDEPGTYAYFCQIHPQMTAELVVEQGG